MEKRAARGCHTQEEESLMKVDVILQARMGSTRLRGKVLEKVMDKPLLFYEVERLRRSRATDALIVATTHLAEDDAIEKFCQQEEIACYRGEVDDVLARYLGAARQYGSEAIVRVSGDCPLIDPVILDRVVDHFKKHADRLDYVSNTFIRTYPRGMDVEVFSKETLETIAKEAHLPEEREHVTVYISRHLDKFRTDQVEEKVDHSSLRLTVDTPEDFTLIKNILEALYPSQPDFLLEDILTLLHIHPEWKEINAMIQQKTI